METFYPIFVSLTAVSLFGLLMCIWDQRVQIVGRRLAMRRDSELVAIAVLGAVALIFFLSLVPYNTWALSPQGRHIFPALAAFVVLGSLGIDTLAPRGRRLRPEVRPAAIVLILLGANLSEILLFAIGGGRRPAATW